MKTNKNIDKTSYKKGRWFPAIMFAALFAGSIFVTSCDLRDDVTPATISGTASETTAATNFGGNTIPLDSTAVTNTGIIFINSLTGPAITIVKTDSTSVTAIVTPTQSPSGIAGGVPYINKIIKKED